MLGVIVVNLFDNITFFSTTCLISFFFSRWTKYGHATAVPPVAQIPVPPLATPPPPRFPILPNRYFNGLGGTNAPAHSSSADAPKWTEVTPNANYGNGNQQRNGNQGRWGYQGSRQNSSSAAPTTSTQVSGRQHSSESRPFARSKPFSSSDVF